MNFTLEKQMIPVLKSELSSLYDTQYFVEEFESGNGIADLVFARDIEMRPTTICDYESIYLIKNFLNRKNKKITYESMLNFGDMNKYKLTHVVDQLLESGFLAEEGTYFIVTKSYQSPVHDLTAIEAKLSDWKNGFYQALRYKHFCNRSYLAIASDFVHRVDQKLLSKHNIGLVSVASDKIEILLNAKKESPKNQIAYSYLSETFCSHFAGEQVMAADVALEDNFYSPYSNPLM